MKFFSMFMLNLLLSISLLTSFSKAQSFYDINTVQSISITFSQSNWDYMLDTAKAGSEGYIMAQSVTINGTVFDSVGVKYKGNSTYNPSFVKNPFHIELDTYKDQDYQGYKDIKLSNAYKDPSFLREVIAYSVLRKYMIAPLSNYCNVSVNGNLIGLYVSSESISKTFLNKNFSSNDNTFFKCNPINGAGPFSTELPNLVYLGNDSTDYMEAYELKSDFGWGDLIGFTDILKNDINNIETVLDVDKALWMLAFDNLIVNLDSYIGAFTQNYYLYKDDNGRFNCFVWDLNESFGTFSMTGTSNLNNTTAKIQMTHLLHSGDANWPLIQKLLSIPTYKKMYLAHLQTILTENFSNNSYLTLAQSIQPVINASVQADPNKFYSYTQYQNNLTTDVNIGMGSAPGLTNLMGNRSTYLLSRPDFTASKPVISGVSPSDTSPVINSSIFISASVTNTNTNAVNLGYRYNKYDKFVKVQMLDDGLHGDGAAGDNIYGASVNVNSEIIQYYIYAENNNTGIFSPVRAEYEFYSINVNTTVSSKILMNEIYSRGNSADPDWIEIYNSSTAEIDITGFKIYDSGGFSGSKPKKVFPSGSVIPAKGFLVIVTDDDDSSGFGLSSSGEKVWLENDSGAVIDTVTYLAHSAAQSYGRLQDGGSWQLLNTITRGFSNSALMRIYGNASIEGFYNAVSNTSMEDTITVTVRSSSSPFNIIADSKGVLNSSNYFLIYLNNAVLNSVPYYIQVNHRNSIETWSKTPQVFTNNDLNYNFNLSANMAYGDNMKEIDSSPLRFGFYSGDLDQDGIINLTDVIGVQNAANTFSTGYISSDMNGDNITDISDVVITNNNSINFISTIKP